jgi:hypothetical protein
MKAMKNNLCLLLILLLSVHIHGQKRKKFSPGAEIAAVDTIAKLEMFQSILFVYQGHSHLVNHYKDFSEKLKKAFSKSDIRLGFDFDLDTVKALKSDLARLPKRIQNPNTFDLIYHVNLKYMKGWDRHKHRRRKQSYVLLLELYQKEELKKRIAITVRTYWTISTQNKAVSKLILEEILP